MYRSDIKIELPDKVKTIIGTLEGAGYEAYAVGGCVRDRLLGREPDDWDITTSALPEEVKALFPRTVDTGIQHGTVTVILCKEGFEVTTYRVDGEYKDGRHPKGVSFTASLKEDLKRRDFTINAMAYNDERGLVDEFDGLWDIQKRRIRAVGTPKERFNEDALRLMRAVRFSAQLGYTIEEGTLEAAAALSGNLCKISAERIQTELVKLLTSPNPDDMRILYETGMTKAVLPEFDVMMHTPQNNPHHCYSVGEHTLRALKEVGEDKALRLAMLFHDVGKPETKTTDEDGIDHFYGHAEAGSRIAKKALRRLKFDNDTIDKVGKIVFFHDYRVEPVPKAVRRAVCRIGEDIFPYLFEVKRADALAQSAYRREEKLEELKRLKEVYLKIMEEKQCVSLKELKVSGSDLIRLGMKPGRELGETLRELLEDVLEHPEHNSRETLLSLPAVTKRLEGQK